MGFAKSNEILHHDIEKELSELWGFIPYKIHSDAPSIRRNSTVLDVECMNCNTHFDKTFMELENMRRNQQYYCPSCKSAVNPTYVENGLASFDELDPGFKEDLQEEYSIMEAIREAYGYMPYNFVTFLPGRNVHLEHKECGTKFTATLTQIIKNRELPDLITGEKVPYTYCPKCNNIYFDEKVNFIGMKFVERLHNHFERGSEKSVSDGNEPIEFPYVFDQTDINRYRDMEVKMVVTCKYCNHKFSEFPDRLFDPTYKSMCPVCGGKKPETDPVKEEIRQIDNANSEESINVQEHLEPAEMKIESAQQDNPPQADLSITVDVDNAIESLELSAEQTPSVDEQEISDNSISESHQDNGDCKEEEIATYEESDNNDAAKEYSETVDTGTTGDDAVSNESGVSCEDAEQGSCEDEYEQNSDELQSTEQPAVDESSILPEENVMASNGNMNGDIVIEDDAFGLPEDIVVEEEPSESEPLMFDDDGYADSYEPTEVNPPVAEFSNPHIVDNEAYNEMVAEEDEIEDDFESTEEIMSDLGIEPEEGANMIRESEILPEPETEKSFIEGEGLEDIEEDELSENEESAPLAYDESLQNNPSFGLPQGIEMQIDENMSMVSDNFPEQICEEGFTGNLPEVSQESYSDYSVPLSNPGIGNAAAMSEPSRIRFGGLTRKPSFRIPKNGIPAGVPSYDMPNSENEHIKPVSKRQEIDLRQHVYTNNRAFSERQPDEPVYIMNSSKPLSSVKESSSQDLMNEAIDAIFDL